MVFTPHDLKRRPVANGDSSLRILQGVPLPFRSMSDQIVNNCPACDCATLGERGMYDICPVCFWEDDGIWSETHPNEPGGGPNYELSLNQVKANFAQYGVCDLKNIKHVRQPTLEEAHGNEDFMMAVEQRQAAEKIQTSPPLI